MIQTINNAIKLPIVVLLLSVALGFGHKVTAQVIDPAGNNNGNSLQLCNGVTCPSLFLFTTNTPPTTLNADMATIEGNGASTTALPAAWGTTTNDYIYGIVYSGANNNDLNNASGLVVGTSLNGTVANLPLPYYLNNQQVTGPANDPDVAVGTYVDASGQTNNHFALVVYEANGHIYLEHYDIIVNTTTTTTYPWPPTTCPPPCTVIAVPNVNNPVLLSQMTAGDSKRPHIEIWHSSTVPSNGQVIYADRYAVTWEYAGPNGNEIWGIDGQIDITGQLHPPTPNNTDFYIDDGAEPDVVAVTKMTYATGGGDDYAFVTYVSPTGDDVMLSRWTYNNTSSVVNLGALSTTTQNNYEYEFPRISGPAYYDYSAPSPTDPLAVVVVNDNDGNSTNLIDKVSSFKYYDPSISPPAPSNIVPKLDISDHNNSDGFSSNSYTGIMPVVTGVGEGVYNMAPFSMNAYEDHPVVFYSDYTNASGNNNYPSGGDFYAFGIHPDESITTPNLSIATSPDGYWEVNYDELQENIAYTLQDKPAVAVATSNNTGYDLLTVFYGGTGTGANQNNIIYSFAGVGSKYAFRPGKETSAGNLSKEDFAIYPNPVKEQLNVRNADGASYKVVDITGREVSSGTLSSNKASVNTANIAAGMYIIHISKDDHTEKVKFVKE